MLKFDVRDLDKLRDEFSPDVVNKAINSAMGKTINKLQTYVSKEIRQTYNIKQAVVKKHARKFRSSNGTTNLLKAGMLYKSRKLGFMNFGAKPKKVTLGRKAKKGRPWGRIRTGVTVQIRKNRPRKLVQSRPGFLAAGENGNIQAFYRDPRGGLSRTGKTKLKVMKGPSIPDMVLASEGLFGETYDQFAAAEYNKEFDVAMNFYLGKMGYL